MTSVNIGRRIKYEDLERALIKAAEQTGLNIRSKENFRKEYQLGSVQELSVYSGTTFYLSGGILPAMEISTDKRWPTDSFSLHSGLGFGFASKRKVRKYLDAVSRHL
ncbi:hypothetical protein COU56_02245 [Candidatus Pacearchaeota archaeon CG10_big_fil_rev_8_21_14_0_10_31_9]|nr:MAG: hypothetical protein AUJ62_03170 [Candidatus Pacearchaeota archaeon CG1_02_32_21]PIN94980.1 MAG: hypothetical protein COU56_02245 [Candidatus Pacearchaeota archaeon CG10_big_fil_rev_8_21_14_0_10_31_9]PIZ82962.1 MAG: hypothetical protein COX97_02160 [Candidatus Pacearchaeota archaeon CG_4_10_14_0_2_um_filter_05_32_18]